ILSVIFSLGVLELGSTIYFRIKDGSFVPIKVKLQAQDNQYLKRNHSLGCEWGDAVTAHPYLGYVYKRSGACALGNVNSLGLRGNEFPMEKKEGEFVIL